jgi:hypothetical protein
MSRACIQNGEPHQITQDHHVWRTLLWDTENEVQRKKRYEDSLKKSLNALHMNHLDWSTLAENRSTWRHTTELPLPLNLNARPPLIKIVRGRKTEQP